MPRPLTRSQVRLIASRTKNQRDSPLWHEYRKRTLTASLFAKAFRAAQSNNKNIIESFVKSWNDGGSRFSFGVPEAIQWGIDNEKNALKAYERILGVKNKKLKLTKTGLWVSKEGDLGASPDGLVVDCKTNDLVGIVEAKCPFSCREYDWDELEENGRWPRYLQAQRGRQIHLKLESDYYFQVQGQLLVTKADWCDFIVWGPRFVKVQRIYPNYAWQRRVVPVLRGFFRDHMAKPNGVSCDIWLYRQAKFLRRN